MTSDALEQFSDAWNRGLRPSLETALTYLQPDEQIGLFVELLKIELLARSRLRETFDEQEYANRFPDFGERIREVFCHFVVDKPTETHLEAVVDFEPTKAVGDLLAVSAVSESTRIGPYRLLYRLGAGGMGEVWAAEQEYPVRRQVALKLIQTGANSKEILNRFDAERQALALMDHQNIARILDAGATESGQPYFVMELVTGRPLTDFCEKAGLGVDERLRIFVDICAGVQHAHQKGVIHRDLKPGNIIVSLQDGVPTPKIIDFGLAKAIDDPTKLTPDSALTGIGQILGTLKYMAPEQASLDNLDIDTRADVYALGIILYELVTGSTPLDDPSLRGQALLQILDFIREKDPPKPSSQVSNAARIKSATDGVKRNSESFRLARLLAGDLDWIIMKAIEKDRERRYESASGFADDIRRYLHSEPVVARPASVAYRVRKFVRKNRVLVGSGCFVVLVLLLGIASTTWALLRALDAESVAEERLLKVEELNREENKQRRLAEERKAQVEVANKGLTEALKVAEERRIEANRNLEHARNGYSVLGNVFFGLSPGAEYETVAELRNALRANLEKGVEELRESPIGDPITVSEIQNTLAVTLLKMGSTDQALELLEECYRTRRELLGETNKRTLLTANNLAGAYRETGNTQKGREFAQQMLAQLEGASGDLKNEAELEASEPFKVTIASCFVQEKKYFEAEAIFREVYESRLKVLGEEHPDTLSMLNAIAVSQFERFETLEAIDTFQRLYELKSRLHGESSMEMKSIVANLAEAYRRIDDNRRAAQFYERALQISRTQLGNDHPDTIKKMLGLGQVYLESDRPDEGVELVKGAWELQKGRYGETSIDSLRVRQQLGVAYQKLRQYEAAIVELQNVVRAFEEQMEPGDERLLLALSDLAQAYEKQGSSRQALPLRERVLQAHKAKGDIADSRYPIALENVGECLKKLEKSKEAIPYFEQAVAEWKRLQGDRSLHTLKSKCNLGEALRSAGEFERAYLILEQALTERKSLFGDKHPETLHSKRSLANCLLDMGKLAEAVRLYAEAYQNAIEVFGTAHPTTLLTASSFAKSLIAAGESATAINILSEARQVALRKYGPGQFESLQLSRELGDLYQASNQSEKAIELYDQMYGQLVESSGPDNAASLRMQGSLATAYWRNRRYDKSIPLFEDLMARMVRLHGKEHPDTQREIANLGVNYKDAGRVKEGLELIEEAYKLMGRPKPHGLRVHLIDGYRKSRQLDPYHLLVSEEIKILRERFSKDPKELSNRYSTFAKDYLALGDLNQAEAMIREAIQLRERVEPKAVALPSYRAILGEILFKQNKRDEAEGILIGAYEELDQRKAELSPAGLNRLPQILDVIVAVCVAKGESEKAGYYCELRRSYF